ncbi:MAG: NUDIX domain-containing protein [Nocardioides sp.]
MTGVLRAFTSVPYANVELAFTEDPPEVDDVSRAHVVAVDPGGHVVVCRSVEEWRFLPGGTREPGETVLELVDRELREEAGCALRGEPVFLCRYVATSGNPTPYRPHLPHPVASWAYYVAPVEVVGEPLNPPDGEQVVQVLALPPPDAATWLRQEDDVHADVVLLAIARGLLS